MRYQWQLKYYNGVFVKNPIGSNYIKLVTALVMGRMRPGEAWKSKKAPSLMDWHKWSLEGSKR